MGNRLLVDENAGPNTPVWKAFQRRFGERAWELYLLELERVRIEFFVIPPRSLELTRRLLAAGPPPEAPLDVALQRLLGDLAAVSVSPCVKGFFHDGMKNKLDALARGPTNEVIRLDFDRVARSVLEASGSAAPG